MRMDWTDYGLLLIGVFLLFYFLEQRSRLILAKDAIHLQHEAILKQQDYIQLQKDYIHLLEGACAPAPPYVNPKYL